MQPDRQGGLGCGFDTSLTRERGALNHKGTKDTKGPTSPERSERAITAKAAKGAKPDMQPDRQGGLGGGFDTSSLGERGGMDPCPTSPTRERGGTNPAH